MTDNGIQDRIAQILRCSGVLPPNDETYRTYDQKIRDLAVELVAELGLRRCETEGTRYWITRGQRRDENEEWQWPK